MGQPTPFFMNCPYCHIPLKSHYLFCPHCGLRLMPRVRRAEPAVWTVVLMLAAVLCLGVLHRWTTGPSSSPVFQNNKNLNGLTSTGQNLKALRNPPSLFPFLMDMPAAPALFIGDVAFTDIAGRPLSVLSAAVSRGGWLAVPVQAALTAYSWRFRHSSGEEVEITGGVLGDHDELGLWQLNARQPFAGPPLRPGRLDAPMIWVSLVSGDRLTVSRLVIASEQQNVIRVVLPAGIAEPGVFIQEEALVGWTFGSVVEGGFLWKGPDENNLVVELGVDDVYRMTFEGGREEAFVLALAMETNDPAFRLSSLMDAFRLPPRLGLGQTPQHLRTGPIVQEMRFLLSRMADNGGREPVAHLMDATVLSAIGDIAFILDALNAVVDADGPETALMLTDAMLQGAVDGDVSENDIRQLTQFRNRLLEKPSEPVQDTPSAHDQPGKLVIRFSPGEGRINTTSLLNHRLEQSFAVDTGATLVTIPRSAAKALGFDLRGAPLRRVATAGGVVEAPEVMLDAIEIDGWVETHVKAFVMDLPEQPHLGLLGLNYLNRFRVDMNTGAGELTLTPRPGDTKNR